MGLKLNPFTGEFDFVGEDNFSYDNVTKPITIPVNQQMIVSDELVISTGDLVVVGTLVLI